MGMTIIAIINYSLSLANQILIQSIKMTNRLIILKLNNSNLLLFKMKKTIDIRRQTKYYYHFYLNITCFVKPYFRGFLKKF